MNQILRYDWLPKRARWSYLARSGPPALSRKKQLQKLHMHLPTFTVTYLQLPYLFTGFFFLKKNKKKKTVAQLLLFFNYLLMICISIVELQCELEKTITFIQCCGLPNIMIQCFIIFSGHLS